jgi:hypothetical protein
VNLATVVAISAATSTGILGFFGFVFREAIRARLKRSVDAYVETLKHDLQREALKAELNTKQKHAIYPRVAAKLRRAEDALNSLVGAEEPDWHDLDETELVAELLRMRIRARHRTSLLEHYRRDRTVAFGELQLAARQAAYEKASGWRPQRASTSCATGSTCRPLCARPRTWSPKRCSLPRSS